MTRIHSIFNRMVHGVLLFCFACGIGVSCTDDNNFSKNESAGEMAALSVKLPKANFGVGENVSARFIAFQAGGGGTSGVLQVNENISSATSDVLVPVGHCNIHIIANAPAIFDLASIDSEAQLKEKVATWEQAKTLPHILVGSYRNVLIDHDGMKDGDGNTVVAGSNMQRLVSKLTVNLQYESLGGTDIVIDSVAVRNRASYAALLPQPFGGDDYVPRKTDLVKEFPVAETTGNITTYQPLEFYLSEYLVDAAHVDKSTCLYIYAHRDGESEPLSYPVYIGDWFGKGYTYEQFQTADSPVKLVGTSGLSVTRNKHYTLTGKLKGAAKAEMTTEVAEWTVVDINGDIATPYLNVAKTDVLVNPLKAEGTSVYYESSVTRENITVDIIENPDNRFTYTISDNSISFIHSNLEVSRITAESGMPITGKAIVTATDGKTKISKEITLGVFNPISRFYVRNADEVDYSSISAATVVDTDWAQDWAKAMGYNNPYQGATTALHTKNPNITLMGGAIPDSFSGCTGYWEDAKNDRNKGQGVWRVPGGEGAENSEAARLVKLLTYLDARAENFDITADKAAVWSAFENSASDAFSAAYDMSLSISPSEKTQTHFIRCVRDLDNANIEGGASFLNVSHNRYEVAPISYRTTIGTVPVYYESDVPVTVSLFDESGKDISNMGSGMPFIGFTAATENALYDITEPPLAFPNSHTRLKKGYFCLHSTVYSTLDEAKTSLGNLHGKMPSSIRKKHYILQFKAGNLVKSMPIVIVNPMGVKNAGFLSFSEAMGVNDIYSGYDYSLKRKYIAQDVKNVPLVTAVSDRTTGCGSYYEGNSTDPRTGMGNWFISPSTMYLGAAYGANFDDWKSQIGSTDLSDIGNLDKVYGEGANFKDADPDNRNGNYWCPFITSANDQHGVTVLTSGVVDKLNKTASANVRCERRLNADMLTLSTQSVSLAQGNSIDIIYYTDAKSIAPLTNEDIIYVSGTASAFTATVTSPGKITVHCTNTAANGSEANLLVHTVGTSKRAETYKIIKLKVKGEPVVSPDGPKFTVELKYKGTVLGDALRVPAKASSGSLEMKNSTGKPEDDARLLLRAADGGAWAKIGHVWSLSEPDVIYHGRSESLLKFEENTGAERQMIAEFYSKKSGLVYHRMIFIQDGTTDYLNLGSSSLSVDRYGNVYDEPFALTVQSNKVWEITSTASWIKVDYTPDTRSQTVEITVEENNSGQPRSSEIDFLIDGTSVKKFTISQSVSENSTFTLKYELNLELNTTNNRFMAQLPTTQGIYYANDVQIYNPGTSPNGDETIKMYSDAQYGFVADAPAGYNKLLVNNIKDKLLAYPNYRGVATSQSNNGGITIGNKEYSQVFFRQIRYDLPIPAGVKRTEKVVYKIKINNINGNADHDAAEISYSISKQ